MISIFFHRFDALRAQRPDRALVSLLTLSAFNQTFADTAKPPIPASREFGRASIRLRCASGRPYWGAPDGRFSSSEPAVLQLLHIGADELQ